MKLMETHVGSQGEAIKKRAGKRESTNAYVLLRYEARSRMVFGLGEERTPDTTSGKPVYHFDEAYVLLALPCHQHFPHGPHTSNVGYAAKEKVAI